MTIEKSNHSLGRLKWEISASFEFYAKIWTFSHSYLFSDSLGHCFFFNHSKLFHNRNVSEKNVELSSKMQFCSKQTRSIQNHAPKLKLRTFPFFQRHTWWRTTNAHACVISRPPWELACSKSNMADELVLFNVQHEEQGVVTQKICNILIFTRAKPQGETCICYSTRKIIHLQVFYGGKQIGKQRTLQRTLKHVLSLLKKIHLAEASPFSMKDWTKRVLKRRTVITGPSISQWNSFVKRTKVQS